MTRIIREATFVLNLEKASADTYQTWVTVRLWSHGLLERKCNEQGNGQAWVAMGYAEAGELTLLNASETQTRIFATVVRRQGVKVAGSYGAAWSKAECLDTQVNRKTGRKLTAAPSIREGKPPRDKNVKARRWNAIDVHAMAAKIAARK